MPVWILHDFYHAGKYHPLWKPLSMPDGPSVGIPPLYRPELD